VLIAPAVNVLLFVPLNVDADVVPFVLIVYETVPTALLVFVVKSNVFPVFIDALLTVIKQSALDAVAVAVAVADFTVVLDALLAVITLVPLEATAVIELPLKVNTFVFPLE
jgi:hypothetical protein